MTFNASFFADIMTDTMATFVGITTVIFIAFIYFVEKVMR